MTNMLYRNSYYTREDNDQYIKGYVKEKNKEIVYILTNKSLCDAMEYILERFSLYSK